MQPTKRLRWALIAILVAAFLSPAIAAAGGVMVKGYPTCGAWIQTRSPDGKPAHDATIWVLGFLSGVAWESNQDIIDSVDPASIDVWMDNYCHAHPLNNVANGVASLAKELQAKKRKS